MIPLPGRRVSRWTQPPRTTSPSPMLTPGSGLSCYDLRTLYQFKLEQVVAEARSLVGLGMGSDGCYRAPSPSQIAAVDPGAEPSGTVLHLNDACRRVGADKCGRTTCHLKPSPKRTKHGGSPFHEHLSAALNLGRPPFVSSDLRRISYFLEERLGASHGCSGNLTVTRPRQVFPGRIFLSAGKSPKM